LKSRLSYQVANTLEQCDLKIVGSFLMYLTICEVIINIATDYIIGFGYLEASSAVPGGVPAVPQNWAQLPKGRKICYNLKKIG